MKKVVVCFILSSVILLCITAYAESDSLKLVDAYIRKVADCSNKQSWIVRAEGYDPALLSITFDFTDGNHTIVAVDGDECIVFYKFEDDEMMSVLFQMVKLFNEIEDQLPNGQSLQYNMSFSETEKHHIVRSTITQYYSWLN